MDIANEKTYTLPIPGKRNFNLAGFVFSIIVTAGFIWVAMQWYALWSDPKQITADDMRLNEQQTFLNLQSIVKLQKKYKETDWDGDGKKTYAKYFIHLWTSVNIAGDPVRVGLIPKKLGFATESARAIDGYYFVDLHDRILRENNVLQGLDYEKEWAVLAVPPTDGRTEMLYFLADNSGNIFIRLAAYISLQYPDNPSSNGWIKIDTIQQLQDFQKNRISKNKQR